MICKLCRRIVAVDTLSKTPSAKVHFAKVTDARPCPCKEVIDPFMRVERCCCSVCATMNT